MRGTKAGGIAALVALCTGCIPSRNNDIDPSNHPVAALAIADWSGPDGRCPGAPIALGAAPEVVSAPVAHCLVLDARRSRDPQDPLSKLEFTFFGENGETLAISSDGYAVIDSSYRLALGLNSGHEMSVVVEARDGVTDAASVTLTVTNREPLLLSDPQTFVLPDAGLPWAPGVDMPVTLTARASDADADPLSICFQTFGVDDRTCVPVDDDGNASLEYSVPAASAYLPVRITAFDGVSHSFPITSNIDVRTPDAWVLDPLGGAARLDGIRRPFPVAATENDSRGFTLLGRETAPMAAVVTAANGQIRLFTYPDMTNPAGVVSAAVPISYDYALASDPAASRIWFAGYEESSNNQVRLLVQSWIASPSGDALTVERALTMSTSRSTPDEEVYATKPLIEIDAYGTAIVTRSYDDMLFFVPYSGTTVENIRSGIVAGLSTRPGTTETWVLVATTAGSVAEIWDLAQNASDPIEVLPLPSTLAWGASFIDTDRLWIYSVESGLLLLEADALRGADPADAILQSFPDVTLSDPQRIRANPVDGSAWVSGLAGRTFVASVNGDLAEFPTSVSIGEFDSRGAALFQAVGTQTALRGSIPAADGRYPALARAHGSEGTYDWPTGGLWTVITDFPGVTTGGLIRLDADGRPLRTVTSWFDAEQGRVEDFDRSFYMRASADARFAWVVLNDTDGNGVPEGFVGLDLTTDPPTKRQYSISGTAIQDGDIRFLEPFMPLPGSDGSKAWAYFRNALTPDVEILDAKAATRTPVYTPSLAERNGGVFGARSPGSNKLCLGTIEAGAIIRLRRISEDGTVELLSQVDHPDTDILEGVAASSDGAQDLCWMVWRDGATTHTIEGWKGVASRVRLGTFADAGAVTDPISTGTGNLWLLVGANRARFDVNATTAVRVDYLGAGEVARP